MRTVLLALLLALLPGVAHAQHGPLPPRMVAESTADCLGHRVGYMLEVRPWIEDRGDHYRIVLHPDMFGTDHDNPQLAWLDLYPYTGGTVPSPEAYGPGALVVGGTWGGTVAVPTLGEAIPDLAAQTERCLAGAQNLLGSDHGAMAARYSVAPFLTLLTHVSTGKPGSGTMNPPLTMFETSLSGSDRSAQVFAFTL